MVVEESVVFSVGLAATCVGVACQLPQIVKIVRTRSAGDVSKLTYGGLTLCIALWLAYGLMRGDVLIIAANAILVVLTSAVLALSFVFGRKG